VPEAKRIIPAHLKRYLQQYYDQNVKLILDGILKELLADERRRFNWAETYVAFFL